MKSMYSLRSYAHREGKILLGSMLAFFAVLLVVSFIALLILSSKDVCLVGDNHPNQPLPEQSRLLVEPNQPQPESNRFLAKSNQPLVDENLQALSESVIMEAAAKGQSALSSIQKRINKIIKKLRKETCEESVKKLSQVEMYVWPGCKDRGSFKNLGTPLPASVGQWDIELIMSNRRFLKVMQELSLLPKNKAANLVNKELSTSLNEYKVLFAAYKEENKERWRKHQDESYEGPRYGPYFQLNNNPDGSPTLLGARLKVLSLVLIAGDLELKGAKSGVINVIQEAISEREFFYNKDLFWEPDAFLNLKKVSLYNRQILGMGVVGTCPDIQKEEQVLLKEIKAKGISERLTHYDASRTPYDLDSWGKGDYSNGEIIVQYLSSLSDPDFDIILNAANIVQSPEPN